MYNIHVLMRDERRKEERSKQDQTNSKAKQHSTPKVVTESQLAGTKGFFSTNTLISRLRTCTCTYRGQRYMYMYMYIPDIKYIMHVLHVHLL